MSIEDVDVFTDDKAMMYSSDTAKHAATTAIGRPVDTHISCIWWRVKPKAFQNMYIFMILSIPQKLKPMMVIVFVCL